MKELLHDRMFESGLNKSHPEHKALYEALEASMDCDNKEEFIDAKDKSRKRRHDDQDPPPPPPKDSDQSKKKRHDSDASGSKQPPPVDDVPIPNDVHISDSEDTDVAHLPKIKTRPDWTVPLNDLPKLENNRANALAKTYKDPEEHKLLRKTGDMGSFIKWYCKQIGKKKLSKADLEGPAFKLVKPFHKNSIQLQFQIEECHLLLTDQIDLVNPEGNRVVPDVSKPLPLGGPPGQVKRKKECSMNIQAESDLLSRLWARRTSTVPVD
ncbi:hypothetical protein Tco_1283662 [Tanacetum coccineum]